MCRSLFCFAECFLSRDCGNFEQTMVGSASAGSGPAKKPSLLDKIRSRQPQQQQQQEQQQQEKKRQRQSKKQEAKVKDTAIGKTPGEQQQQPQGEQQQQQQSPQKLISDFASSSRGPLIQKGPVQLALEQGRSNLQTELEVVNLGDESPRRQSRKSGDSFLESIDELERTIFPPAQAADAEAPSAQAAQVALPSFSADAYDPAAIRGDMMQMAEQFAQVFYFLCFCLLLFLLLLLLLLMCSCSVFSLLFPEVARDTLKQEEQPEPAVATDPKSALKTSQLEDSIKNGCPSGDASGKRFKRQLEGQEKVDYQQARTDGQRAALRKAWAERELKHLKTGKAHAQSWKEVDESIGTYLPLEKIAEAYGFLVNPTLALKKAARYFYFYICIHIYIYIYIQMFN